MKRIFLTALVILGCFQSTPAVAGVFEFSFGIWFNRSNYSEESFAWTRRLGSSFAFHFNQHSGIEVGAQLVRTRTKLVDAVSGISVQDTTYDDQIYSVNWVQHVLGKRYVFQPFFKAGIAQINRDIKGTFFGSSSRVRTEDTLTFSLSLGFRLFFTKRIGFRAEGTTYFTDGGFGTWDDNLAGNMGLSIFF